MWLEGVAPQQAALESKRRPVLVDEVVTVLPARVGMQATDRAGQHRGHYSPGKGLSIELLVVPHSDICVVDERRWIGGDLRKVLRSLGADFPGDVDSRGECVHRVVSSHSLFDVFFVLDGIVVERSGESGRHPAG